MLNALARRAPFDVLIVSELSRLGREQLDVGYMMKQLSIGGKRSFCICAELERDVAMLRDGSRRFLGVRRRNDRSDERKERQSPTFRPWLFRNV